MKEELVTLETVKLLNAVLPYRDFYQPSRSLVQNGYVKSRTYIFLSLETLAVMAMIYAKLTMELI